MSVMKAIGALAVAVALCVCGKDHPSSEVPGAETRASVSRVADPLSNQQFAPPAPSALAHQPSATKAERSAADACAPASRVAPSTLAATWPARVGQRVRLAAKIERALDYTDVLLLAAGQRFVAMIAPDQLWEGTAEHTYTVLGSKTVALAGRTTLPELLFDDACK